MSETVSRKKDHVDLCVTADAAFREKTTGFERWEFEHNALPELDVRDIDMTTEFLGKTLSFPLIVTGMTGGYEDAGRINGALAEAAQEHGIAIGAGSMRQALEDDSFHASYRILRTNAPSVPVVANIGAVEAARMSDASEAQRLVDLLEADALAVHSNPLQEFLQPEGSPDFTGVLRALEMLARDLPVPVILKEVGSGISASAAKRAYDAGIRIIDVAGAGGTSWSGVEMLRRDDGIDIAPGFHDWGIQTAMALRCVGGLGLRDVEIIASGGICDGILIAKSIALGAALAGSARPLIKAFFDGGEKALHRTLKSWKHDLLGVMFVVGVGDIASLKKARIREILVSPD